MVTIQVRHDLDVDSLIQALMWASGDMVEAATLTRATVEDYVRDFMATYGDMGMAEADIASYYSDKDLARRREWAQALITRFWPAMAKEAGR